MLGAACLCLLCQASGMRQSKRILRQVGRYNALHGFNAVREERHEGRMITRGVRTSVTLRRLL